jgi:hypothetical protein
MSYVNTGKNIILLYISGNLISQRKDSHVLRMTENGVGRVILLPIGYRETSLQKYREN